MKEIINRITELGGVITSSYEPEGDTYKIIKNNLYFSICPYYNLVDIYYNYPSSKKGRYFYKEVISFNSIIDFGGALYI